jgi:hypothetical protein
MYSDSMTPEELKKHQEKRKAKDQRRKEKKKLEKLQPPSVLTESPEETPIPVEQETQEGPKKRKSEQKKEKGMTSLVLPSMSK